MDFGLSKNNKCSTWHMSITVHHSAQNTSLKKKKMNEWEKKYQEETITVTLSQIENFIKKIDNSHCKELLCCMRMTKPIIMLQETIYFYKKKKLISISNQWKVLPLNNYFLISY